MSDKPASPTRPLTRLSAETRRKHIAEAALRALQTHGHAGLTARKVAAEAGLSLGHLTYHYKDMAEVLSAAFRLAADQVQEAGRRALIQPGGTPSERLDRFLRAGFTTDLMTPAHLRLKIDLWSAALTRPEIASIERALYDSHRDALERLLDRMAAGYAFERIPAVADLIMATLDGLWLDWLRRGDELAVKNGLDGCVLFARLRLGGN
ncbi:MAG: TetR family transcriptional regulator C-terminal domain-containing protein [Cypionkella sp.]|uniref:TetR/AcrR family transcriptional regulator n=1 Tax=Cypionkella sp. TaxID=2811411 RepID=UPI002ABA2383|nr:TetR family transcriptional regulator C-terminal domain-containing protein [Cypionkella sp.]MDZ4311347.1 TetR family transcriptional regulator C-terminal domain-containing protein [Cypionkella sp.]MDZ4393775.1 TetR family transcriptional regulator C-terminal domain-containing protein [Cypionkella sp.]